MTAYIVRYLDLFVTLEARDPEHAEERSHDLFQLKYPELKEIDTDDIIVEEVPVA